MTAAVRSFVPLLITGILGAGPELEEDVEVEAVDVALVVVAVSLVCFHFISESTQPARVKLQPVITNKTVFEVTYCVFISDYEYTVLFYGKC